MTDCTSKTNDCFGAADILLPENCDLQRWAVIACDQFTSQPEYWEQVDTLTEGVPSAGHLILPECRLSSSSDETISRIHETMKKYIREGLMQAYPGCFLYTERTLLSGQIRCGLIGNPLGHSWSPEIPACFGDYGYTLWPMEEDAVARLSEEMDGRHFGIDLELADGCEQIVLGCNLICGRIRIAEQEPVSGGQHDIDGFPVNMEHHFVVTIECSGGFQHIGKEARSGVGSGIKKNCLIARQF